jgi:hypothetical protein
MEPEDSLPFPQKPSASLHPETDKSNAHPHTLTRLLLLIVVVAAAVVVAVVVVAVVAQAAVVVVVL